MTQKWYATLCHPKMHPHTKFGIPTSKNIGDMDRTQKRDGRTDTRTDGLTDGRTVRLLYASQSSFGSIKNKISKMHLQHELSKAYQYLLIWALVPSFFGTPLRSHYSIFSPQIMQESGVLLCIKTKIIYATNQVLISLNGEFICRIGHALLCNIAFQRS